MAKLNLDARIVEAAFPNLFRHYFANLGWYYKDPEGRAKQIQLAAARARELGWRNCEFCGDPIPPSGWVPIGDEKANAVAEASADA